MTTRKQPDLDEMKMYSMRYFRDQLFLNDDNNFDCIVILLNNVNSVVRIAVFVFSRYSLTGFSKGIRYENAWREWTQLYYCIENRHQQ